MNTPEKSKLKTKLALATGITVATILLATTVKKRKRDNSYANHESQGLWINGSKIV